MRRIGSAALVVAALVGVTLVVSPRVGSGKSDATLFAATGRHAVGTLLDTYYAGAGEWRACDATGCPTGNIDWGYDSLTYAVALAAAGMHDARLLPALSALATTAPAYPTPCVQVTGCAYWSDTPEWDAVALADEYLATGDATALAKAQAAYSYVAGSQVFALGACPSIPYQQPGGGGNRLKTLETEANAVKAALLLYRATGDAAYLAAAVAGYAAARVYFLDPRVALYTVYSFDDGHSCRQLPHRFFASVNGDMIWSGAELAMDTGQPTYLEQAVGTAQAVDRYLTDARGVFVDLQAENDVVEPLVEAMALLAQGGQPFARQWLLRNAAASLSARTPDGSFGRFFDGPPPQSTVTAWQTNGGLALQIAAAAIAPTMALSTTQSWRAVRLVQQPIAALPSTLRFRGFGIALLGTLGDRCCERGHARVLVDGRETFDQSGIWQNKSSARRSIPGTILFAWRWRTAGLHQLTFLPGAYNGKEGGPFLRIAGYDVLGGSASHR